MANVNVDFRGRNVNLAQVTKEAERALQRLVKAGRGQQSTVTALRNAAAASKLAYQEQRQAIDLATRSARRLGVEQANQIRTQREQERQARRSEAAAKRQERAINRQTRSIGRLGAALQTVAFDQIERGFERIAQRADSFLRITRSFQNLALSSDVSGERLLRNAREATRGIITDLDLLRAANFGLLLGLDLTEESFADLAKTAVTLGRTVDQGPVKSLNDLLLALGRGSPRILDNLGLIVKVSEANRIYAERLNKTTAELTGSEKQTAFFNLAVEQANIRVREVGGVILTAGDHFQRFYNSLLNFADQFSTITGPVARLGEAIAGTLVPLATLRLTMPELSKSVVAFGGRAARAIHGFGLSFYGPLGAIAGAVALGEAIDYWREAIQNAQLERIAQLGRELRSDVYAARLAAENTLLREQERVYGEIVALQGRIDAIRERPEGGTFLAGFSAETIALNEDMARLTEQFTALALQLDNYVEPEVIIRWNREVEVFRANLAELVQQAQASFTSLTNSLRGVDPLSGGESITVRLARESREARVRLAESLFETERLQEEHLARRREQARESSRIQVEQVQETIDRIRGVVERESFADALQIQDIQRAFEGLFDIITGDAEDFGDRMRRLFRQLSSDILSALVFRRISESIVRALGGSIPGAQSGGYRRGLTLVGEAGPELVDFRDPARVYPNDQLEDIIRGGSRSATYIYSPTVHPGVDQPTLERTLQEQFVLFQEFTRRDDIAARQQDTPSGRMFGGV